VGPEDKEYQEYVDEWYEYIADRNDGSNDSPSNESNDSD
jgi:hypothetical protein